MGGGLPHEEIIQPCQLDESEAGMGGTAERDHRKASIG